MAKSKKKPDAPERLVLDVVEKQALLSIYVETEKALEAAQKKTAARDAVVKEILQRNGYDPECWLDVTNVEHGVVRISANDPNSV
jgi:hypothetical protein